MASSMFYAAAFERRFALPFLFFEHLAVLVKAYDGIPDDVDMERMIKDCLKDCLGMSKVSNDDMIYVADRLAKLADEQEGKKAEPPSTKRSFASSYALWVSKLEPDKTCLIVADFNLAEAKRLFTEVDKDDVLALSESWIAKSWEDIKIAYECCIYGFGGGYKDSGPEDGGDTDASTNDHTQGKVIPAAALAAVKF